MVGFLVALAIGLSRFAQGSDPSSSWPVVYQDDLEDPRSGWLVGDTEDVRRVYAGLYS